MKSAQKAALGVCYACIYFFREDTQQNKMKWATSFLPCNLMSESPLLQWQTIRFIPLGKTSRFSIRICWHVTLSPCISVMLSSEMLFQSYKEWEINSTRSRLYGEQATHSYKLCTSGFSLWRGYLAEGSLSPTAGQSIHFKRLLSGGTVSCIGSLYPLLTHGLKNWESQSAINM